MSKYLLKNNRIYYLIFSTYKKIPIFSSYILSSLIEDYLFYYYSKYDFKIYSYSIMPCHFNLMVKFVKGIDIENFEHDLKSYSTNQLLFYINNIENLDYEYVCGKNCFCKKFPIDNVSGEPLCSSRINENMFINSRPGHRGPGLTSNPVSGQPPCCPRSITQETLNIIKLRQRIWRHESWKEIMDDEEQFDQKLNYTFNNYKKHHLKTSSIRYIISPYEIPRQNIRRI
ncbi:MAG: transposase [Patescibacteria group bacterium]|nr:transposase [Patescibacteria group bacterium]